VYVIKQIEREKKKRKIGKKGAKRPTELGPKIIKGIKISKVYFCWRQLAIELAVCMGRKSCQYNFIPVLKYGKQCFEKVGS